VATETYTRIDGWMNVRQVADLFSVAPTTIARQLERWQVDSHDLQEFGKHEHRLCPTLVLRLAKHYKTAPLTEVGGALVTYAEAHAGAERAKEIESEIETFLEQEPDGQDTSELADAHARFLAVAKTLVPDGTYRQLESAYRTAHGVRGR
jgi:hypothetical protein